RIALVDYLGAVRVDLEATLDRHAGFIDPRIGYGRIVRCPPVAGVAIHFLIGDKLGHTIADRVGAVESQSLFAAVGQINHPQVALAYEADVPTLGRDLGVGRETTARSQTPRAALGRRDVIEIQL